jgi:hypothetical protein
MIPDLDQTKAAEDLPCGAMDLRDGYVLLCAQEEKVCALQDCEAEALQAFLPAAPRREAILVCQWARLQIPTSQICNSA